MRKKNRELKAVWLTANLWQSHIYVWFGCRVIIHAVQCNRSLDIRVNEREWGVVIFANKHHSVPPSTCNHTHTPPYLPHGLCVVLCADLQPAHPVLPLFGTSGWKTQEWAKPCYGYSRIILLGIDSCTLLHHRQWIMENIQINIEWTWWMVMTVDWR